MANNNNNNNNNNKNKNNMNTECSGYENVFLPGNKSYIMMMMMQNA
jgi:hypothetical protein